MNIDRMQTTHFRADLKLSVLFVVGGGSIVLVTLSPRVSPFTATIGVFVIALVCLSTLAFRKHSAPIWPYVDYPWICATVVSVFIAISGNTTNVNYAKLVEARQEFRTAISEVLAKLDSNLDRNCVEVSTSTVPENEDLGSCLRTKHLLYQAQGDFRIETIQSADSQHFPQNWASEFCSRKLTPGHEQWNIYTEDGELCAPMHEFDAAKTKIDLAVNVYESNKSFLDYAAKDGRLRYWYYFYAGLAALRLSRVTADFVNRKRAARTN